MNNRYSPPITTHIAPGTKKALRHPAVSIKKPDISAAQATPIFPNTPFMASATPVLVRPCTTIASPTG
jgi:hypothetical protein